MFQSHLAPLRAAMPQPHHQHQMLAMIQQDWDSEFVSYFLSVLGARERAYQEWVQRTAAQEQQGAVGAQE